MTDEEKIKIITRGLQRILKLANPQMDTDAMRKDPTLALVELVDVTSRCASIRTEVERLNEDLELLVRPDMYQCVNCGPHNGQHQENCEAYIPPTHVRENDIKVSCKSDPCECGAGTCASHGTHNCSICEKNGSGHWSKCPCDRCERIRFEKGEASVKKVDLHISGGKCTCFRCREAKEGKKLPPLVVADIHEDCDGKKCEIDVVEKCPKWESVV